MPERVAIVGAGPVGSLLALTLARRGHHVDLFERRPDLRSHVMSAGRSINLAVSVRGLHALHAVGLDQAVLEHTVPMRGRMIHSKDGGLSLLPYGRDASEHIHSMSRGGLNKLLMTEAEATGRVVIRFQQRLTAYDFASRTGTFHDEVTGSDHTVDLPVVFGADGSASALRQAMVRDGGHRVDETPLDFGYKELTIPPATHGLGPDGQFALEPEALHIWPRGAYMLIALPNPDGSFTATLFLPFTAPPGQPAFDRLQDEAAVLAFFQAEFPDAVPHLPGLATAFAQAPLGHMVTVKAWPWSLGSAGLIGDAAHAIVPFFGQGMNAGFEDCTVLAGLLDRQPSGRIDWAKVMADLAGARKPDTDAIADLAVENFVEMRDKVADPTFLLQRAVETELSRRMPGEYLTRYQLVTFTRVPYRKALAIGQVQADLLGRLTAHARTVADVDLAQAEALVRAQVTPALREAGAI